ncbi:hypothetical protein PC129_g14529 [Phytophthora cactorum]|uniref:Uncharacterized protein n=1 Tax=Phytophthora cactorum TaxID=29920 RepID=A0A8T1BKN9_9STRA|nr:hypothetical protein PC115_g15647 [Phytophthora cactorum]KAG3214561.1 hypothetical protein PC129_g14529 [Phytophthora cactorum]
MGFFLFVNDILTPDEATKKKSTKHQQHAQISPGEYGVELLQKTKLNMLKFVTLVNRRWRALKDLLARKPLDGRVLFVLKIREKTDTDDES